MDLPTIQAIAAVVQIIGLSGTIGVVTIIAAWNLLPVLADLLRSKIAVNHATALAISNGHVPATMAAPTNK